MIQLHATAVFSPEANNGMGFRLGLDVVAK
jgi:hypothetical protein